MNVLILGDGYIGNHLYKHLMSNNTCVIFSRKNLDYTVEQILIDYITENQIDCVINASGYTGKPNVDACEDDKQTCWYNNVVVPKTIEQACKHVELSADYIGCNKKRHIKYIHVSSGCIYTGYDKPYTEEDEPNFGLYNKSSWYSKTKHAGETVLDKNYTTILRIRMPFSSCMSDRNFIVKMLKYDNLVSRMNSMTCVEDFCDFVSTMLSMSLMYTWNMSGIYNVVHTAATCAHDIVHLLQCRGVDKKFKFDDSKIIMKAPRSNCILSDAKILSFNMPLPDINRSLETAISNVAEEYNKESIW